MSSALVLPAVRGASPDADVAECRRILAAGSKSFALAGQALPAEARDAAAALYAFCRVADDLVDLGDDPRAAIEVLSTRLDGIYAGHPADDPVDRAFARVVHAYQVPRAILDALIEGFVWDAERRRYDTLSEVVAYGVRVASTVGLAMTLLLRRRAPVTLARAADLGIAMQLTNIARDVGEDWERGRLYVPNELLAQHGADGLAGDLGRPLPHHARAPLAGAMRDLLALADVHYRASARGIRRCRGAPRSPSAPRAGSTARSAIAFARRTTTCSPAVRSSHATPSSRMPHGRRSPRCSPHRVACSRAALGSRLASSRSPMSHSSDAITNESGNAFIRYVSRIREFERVDWIVYLGWVGMMFGLVLSTGGLPARSAAPTACAWPAEAWLVPIGAFIFSVAIAIDTIGHRTVYKEVAARRRAARPPHHDRERRRERACC
jgi:phytoene synthase